MKNSSEGLKSRFELAKKKKKKNCEPEVGQLRLSSLRNEQTNKKNEDEQNL